jgi:hypothetical protein
MLVGSGVVLYLLYRITPISTEPYSWVGFHLSLDDDVRYKMQAISSSSSSSAQVVVDGAALHRHEAGLHMQIHINK